MQTDAEKWKRLTELTFSSGYRLQIKKAKIINVNFACTGIFTVSLPDKM